jgi:hypothetical protein
VVLALKVHDTGGSELGWGKGKWWDGVWAVLERGCVRLRTVPRLYWQASHVGAQARPHAAI